MNYILSFILVQAFATRFVHLIIMIQKLKERCIWYFFVVNRLTNKTKCQLIQRLFNNILKGDWNRATRKHVQSQPRIQHGFELSVSFIEDGRSFQTVGAKKWSETEQDIVRYSDPWPRQQSNVIGAVIKNAPRHRKPIRSAWRAVCDMIISIVDVVVT